MKEPLVSQVEQLGMIFMDMITVLFFPLKFAKSKNILQYEKEETFENAKDLTSRKQKV